MPFSVSTVFKYVRRDLGAPACCRLRAECAVAFRQACGNLLCASKEHPIETLAATSEYDRGRLSQRFRRAFHQKIDIQGEFGPDARNTRFQLVYIADKPRRNPSTRSNTTTCPRHSRFKNSITRPTLRARFPGPHQYIRVGGSTGSQGPTNLSLSCSVILYLDCSTTLSIFTSLRRA